LGMKKKLVIKRKELRDCLSSVESNTDAKQEVLTIIEELACADRYTVTEECKALVKASEGRFTEAIEAYAQTGEDLDFTWDRWEKTLLIVASGLGYKKAVVTLLENGANPDGVRTYGITALMKAVENGHVDIVNALIEHGASVNIEKESGGNALTEAVENGLNEVADILLSHGSEINIQNNIGYTPLTYAAEKGNIYMVNTLLERGALPNLKTIPNRGEDNAVIKAASNGHDAVVSALLAHGGDVDSANKWGVTGLLYAAKHGHTKTVSVLLQNGASVEGKKKKETPLMVAAEHGNEEIVGILLKHGANVKAKGSYGNTPLDYARYGKHTKIQKMMEEYL